MAVPKTAPTAPRKTRYAVVTDEGQGTGGDANVFFFFSSFVVVVVVVVVVSLVLVVVVVVADGPSLFGTSQPLPFVVEIGSTGVVILSFFFVLI